VYRMFGRDFVPLVDLLAREGEDAVPRVGEPYLCRHPADDTKQVRVKPSFVVPLLNRVWIGKNYLAYCDTRGIKVDRVGLPEAVDVNLRAEFPSLTAIREYSKLQLSAFRDDHKRPLNPTPYKVSVPPDFYRCIKALWEAEAPVAQLE
jgi:nicotinate phosphoribosyltransferase